jgi:hypothetical protein
MNCDEKLRKWCLARAYVADDTTGLARVKAAELMFAYIKNGKAIFVSGDNSKGDDLNKAAASS